MQPKRISSTRKTRTLKNSDHVMKNTWHTLRQDFSSSLGFQIGTTAKSLLNNSVSEFRDYVWPLRTELPVYHLKCEYQLENFLKRYRFEHDRYTDDDLAEMQLRSQIANIVRLSTPFEPNTSVRMVLSRARHIIRETLGDYDEEEHLDYCRFGKSPLEKGS